MSLSIQTANGLLEISGKVTEEKVISALGYEPAKKEIETAIDSHTRNTDIHITAAEREIWNKDIENLEDHKSDETIHITSKERDAWNNKSDFSGAYADLIDAPSIVETESGNMVIADEGGNIIMQVDANGLETTTVTAKSAVINGVDITVKLDEHKESINGVSGNLTTHTSNSTVHITADERVLWNNKSDFSGDYNDLTNAPDIKEDNSGEVVYADESGNVIAKIGENGLETTQVIANNVVASGVNIGEVLSSHTSNDDIHITAAERETWNSKVDATYVDTAVANLVNSAPEALNTLDELAAALGDDANFATTVTTQIGLKVDKTTFDAHTHTKSQIGLGNVDNTSDANKPVSTAQREALNELKSELSESIVSEAEEWTVADNSGNIITKVNAAGLETTTVTAKAVIVNGADVKTTLDGLSELVGKKSVQTQISEAIAAENLSQYATDTDLATHTSNTTVHITSAERTAWNAKANQTDFKTHTDDQSNPHKVTKSQIGLGNVDNTSDINKPVSTAQQTALDNLKSELSESIVSESNEWTVADNSGNIVARVDSDGFETTTVTAQKVVVNSVDIETALDSKANSEHTHDQYLEANDIAGKADKTYVDTELAKKANSSHTHEQYLVASDIENKADKSELHTHSNKAELDKITSGKVASWDAKATTSYVDEQLATKVSKEELNAKGYLTAIPDEYVTETELNAKNYLTTVPEEYITENELNSKGYLTQHQDLSNYAKKSDVPEVINNLTSASTTAALSAAQGAVLKTTIDNIIGDIGELGGGDMMKATYDTNNNGVVDNAEKLDGHTADYFATSDHSHNNYLTSGDIANKADKTYVDEQLATKVPNTRKINNKPLSTDITLSASDIGALPSTTVIPSIDGLATTSYVNEQLNKKANSSHTHEEYLVASDIANKADKSELHTHSNKSELDKITSGKVAAWDNKSDFSGSYNDLTDTPNVLDDKSAEFLISDEDKNVIFRVDINGTRTTVLEVDSLVLAGKDVSESYCTKADITATIGTTWSGDTAPYSQDITVIGITADDNPIVDVAFSGTYATDQARLADWGKIYRIVTAENKITVYATAKTAVALPIQLQVVG